MFWESLKIVFEWWNLLSNKTTDWFEETIDCLFWNHNRKTVFFDWALNVLTEYAPVIKCFDQSILNAIKSLLRFDNKLYLCINSEKLFLENSFLKRTDLKFWELRVFQRVLRLLKSWKIDQGSGIGFYLYWFQIFISNKCNLCKLLKQFVCVFYWDWLCVLEVFKISNLSVGQGECVYWGFQGHSLGCCVSNQGVVA